MAIKNLKLNLNSLLKDYAKGKDNSASLVKVMTPIVKKPEVKREIARQMIDAIIDRTLAGKDKRGNDFTGYSEAYKKSLKFKIYKGSKRKPDLKLTGDMQTAIDVVKVGLNDIEIGFNDELEEKKAEGHVMGANYLPVRDFWGLPDKETQYKILESIIKDYNAERLASKLEFVKQVTQGSELETENEGE